MIEKLNRAFENRIRLGLMSILMVNDWVEFNKVKTLLNATDGNVASHVAALEALDYIEIKKEFVGKRPRTSYRVTNKGRKAFKDHLDALEEILKNQQL